VEVVETRRSSWSRLSRIPHTVLQRTTCRHTGAYDSPAYLIERLVKSLLATTRGLEGLSQHRLLRETSVYVDLFDVMAVVAVRAD